MSANVLNLPTYTVTALHESGRDYHVKAVTVREPVACPNCHHNKLDSYGRREQMVKDLPLHRKPVDIHINTRRYRCKSCGKTFYEALLEINQKRLMTNRLVAWIGEQAIIRTFSSIAEEVGVTEGTIRHIFKGYVAHLEKAFCFEIPIWMGLDEIDIIKPRCIVTNIQSNTIVELLLNRNKDTVARYLNGLAGKNNVQYVAMGIWAPYRDACQTTIPEAKIVIGKRHLVRLANEAMECVRKNLRESLTLKQRRSLAHDRLVLLKRERDLTSYDQLLLSSWSQSYDVLGEAYKLKEQFFQIYDARSSEEAQVRFANWKRNVSPKASSAFSNLVRALDDWMPLILNHFAHPEINAYAESLNSLTQITNRLGRGYSFEALRVKILFTEGTHKTVEPKVKYRIASGKGSTTVGTKGGTARNFGWSIPTEAKKSSGAEISTLARLIKVGSP